MKILVINSGSQSLKFQIIDAETEVENASGQIERIGIDGILTYKKDGNKTEENVDAPNHVKALELILGVLTSQERGVISSLDEIQACGHRVGHGGAEFNKSVIVDDEVLKKIESLTDLAPLHMPANIMGIKACMDVMPGVPQVAVFDTAFHQTIPPKAYLYAIPIKYYKELGVRKYGFHGTSFSYVLEKVCELQGLDINNSKVIICHIGSGASVGAFLNGKSIDTTMGMTPLEGLVMGTRSGDIDPGIFEYICQKENLSVEEFTKILNKESGMLGLSGISNDNRDLLEEEAKGNEDAKNALDAYIYRIQKYVGAFYMALGGVDVIALCGGAGENNLTMRGRMVESFGALGIKLDEAKNTEPGVAKVLSTDDSKIPVWTIPTNEELKIARETHELVK
ncbi:MAG: acetate kinase [Lachnospiraceae bacterium]|nr:acetate kinase [Lachnospiraceae bacterium]